MTSLGVHLRLLKKKREFVTRLSKNARDHLRLLLLNTHDIAIRLSTPTPHALGLGFRARGFRFGTGFGAWGLRFRLAGFRDYRVQGLG